MTFRTEDEARKAWCPMARAGYDGLSVNRGDNAKPDRDCVCIASQCMAWRWRFETAASRAAAGGRQGYCGAFARPTDEQAHS